MCIRDNTNAANAAREAAEAEIAWAKAEAKEERDTALAELEASLRAEMSAARLEMLEGASTEYKEESQRLEATVRAECAAEKEAAMQTAAEAAAAALRAREAEIRTRAGLTRDLLIVLSFRDRAALVHLSERIEARAGLLRAGARLLCGGLRGPDVELSLIHI